MLFLSLSLFFPSLNFLPEVKQNNPRDRISGLETLAGNLGLENKCSLKYMKQVKGILALILKLHLILTWQITSFQPQANPCFYLPVHNQRLTTKPQKCKKEY